MIGKILSILDWIKDKLPIQDRIERWKNEIDNLKKEKEKILNEEWSIKKSKRLDYINSRIEYINQLFKNKADSS